MTSERNGAHRYRVTPQGLVLEVGYSYFVRDVHTGYGRWENGFRRATPSDISDPALLVGVPDS
jgi:hypothetical protein